MVSFPFVDGMSLSGLISGIFGNLSKTLSIALCVSEEIKTFLPCLVSCAVISAITCVFPVPGGPCKRNILSLASARFTASFCLSFKLSRHHSGSFNSSFEDCASVCGENKYVGKNGFFTYPPKIEASAFSCLSIFAFSARLSYVR